MIPLCIPEIRGNEWKYVKECLDTNWVSSVGKYVDEFENRFSEYTGAKKAVVTVNGTAAIQLALNSLGIGKDDEVIVPSLTFVASVNPILYSGARPVFADVCRDTFVMDVTKIEKLITKNTKAILPVHIYGHPVDMKPLMELARKYNLSVIEDATEALGSEYMISDGEWVKLGAIGDIGCFSFNGNKLITTGAGGMMITDNISVGEKAKFLSTQAKTVADNKAFFHDEVGYNFRMPNLLAAVGVAQLESIEEYVEAKRRNAAIYNDGLNEIDGITLPVEKTWAKNCHWMYSVVIEDSFVIDRNTLINKLYEKGIETRPFFMPIHTMPPYAGFDSGDMTVTDELALKGINLPSSVSLKEEEIGYICNTIHELSKGSNKTL